MRPAPAPDASEIRGKLAAGSGIPGFASKLGNCRCPASSLNPGYGQCPDYGTGSAVVDLIFSIAKREVTFLSGIAAISRL
jgi:hypothetical protein